MRETSWMGRQFADLPRWEFTELEISNGAYRVTARRDGGITGEATGTDFDAALAGLRDWAAKVERELANAERSAGVECPVCGAAELTSHPYATWPPPPELDLRPPYEDLLGTPSYEVCPNCGFEFGNDDNPGTAAPDSFETYRNDWAVRGSPRFFQGRRGSPSRSAHIDGPS